MCSVGNAAPGPGCVRGELRPVMLADSAGGLETDWSLGILTLGREFFCSACHHSVGSELDLYSPAVPVPLCVNFLCLSFLIIKTMKIMITN